MLTAALAIGALVAGLAGGWSPCGLSMVETLTAAQTRLGRIAGAFAFVAGALIGGLVTFGGLGLAGAALGGGAGAWTVLAALALVAAAVGDGAGRRIVPQVRRQVPESWRRRLPLSMASALYGVLLGLGFTTFVLSFATYALAACALALGDPVLGAVIGAAFAAGRALPVVAAAPSPHGGLAAAMAERPAVLRALRAAAAVALLAAAAFALAPAPAQAAAPIVPERVTADGTDPSAAAGVLAWQDEPGTGLVQHEGRLDRAPGADPAVAGGRIAWHDAQNVTVARLPDFRALHVFPAPGATEIALTSRWVAWLVRGDAEYDEIVVADLQAPESPPRVVAASRGLGRPSIDGDKLVYHVAGTLSSRIVMLDLVTGEYETLRRSVGGLLLNPSLVGFRLLYVESTRSRQHLRLGDVGVIGGADRSLYSITPTARRDVGREPQKRHHRAGYPNGERPPAPRRPSRGVTVTLWTTALDATNAYVTRLRHRPGGVTESMLLKLELGPARRRR